MRILSELRLLRSDQRALHAAGSFFLIALASSMPAAAQTCTPAWDPGVSPFIGNPGVSAPVHALTLFDDGTGPALYAGGRFPFVTGVTTLHYIGKWDGASWSALGGGMGRYVNAMAVFDDGTGPALYAGGNFTSAGGAPANYIAKWDGSTWSTLGSGVSGTFVTDIRAMTVFDDGTGPALYVGGSFTSAGGVSANYIAKWNGAIWAPVGIGFFAPVNSLAVFDDGTGPALYAGGEFVTSDGVTTINRIAKWDGASWTALGSGLSGGPVNAMTVFDDGTGPVLYAGGSFTGIVITPFVPAAHIAKWNGSTWSALGNGVNNIVHGLTVFDDGAGAALYAGGDFTSAGGAPANFIAQWNGSAWSPLASGTNNRIDALIPFDDGTGPALYVGGWFTTAGGIPASRIAKYNGCAMAVNPADFNGDGSVNAADLATLLAQWGPCPPPPSVCAADLNGDGTVNAADLASLLANWG